MAEKELLLGIDLGTSGCKVTLIDTDCNFVGDGYTEYTTYHPNIGCRNRIRQTGSPRSCTVSASRWKRAA